MKYLLIDYRNVQTNAALSGEVITLFKKLFKRGQFTVLYVNIYNDKSFLLMVVRKVVIFETYSLKSIQYVTRL